MAHADVVPPVLPSDGAPKPFAIPRKLVLFAMVLLLFLVAGEGVSLYQEWRTLREEMNRARHSDVIGYLNISPKPSYARQPDDWVHDEGESTLLWSGWKQGNGHRWFRVGRGEIDPRKLSIPMGRDAIQAIDYPLTENGAGKIWTRIPTDAVVVALELAGVTAAYPVQILDKVCVINDQVGERPCLVTFNPLGTPQNCVHVYDPIVNGRRFVMGTSGYIQDQKLMLYDRGTESLWIDDEATGTLKAIAGPSKGTVLHSLIQPSMLAWGEWSTQHPQGRLLIGADRSKVIPID